MNETKIHESMNFLILLISHKDVPQAARSQKKQEDGGTSSEDDSCLAPAFRPLAFEGAGASSSDS